MARVSQRLQATSTKDLEPLLRTCPGCSTRLNEELPLRRNVCIHGLNDPDKPMKCL